MIGSRVGIEKLLLNTETVNRLERYWNSTSSYFSIQSWYLIDRTRSFQLLNYT